MKDTGTYCWVFAKTLTCFMNKILVYCGGSWLVLILALKKQSTNQSNKTQKPLWVIMQNPKLFITDFPSFYLFHFLSIENQIALGPWLTPVRSVLPNA